MDVNAGQVVERIVRREGRGICALSKKLNVSRRTVYNWFDHESLSLEVICKIGIAIDHDFSKEFPVEFEKNGNQIMQYMMINSVDLPDSYSNSINYWINKYVKLLEKYNELLCQEQKGTL